MLPTRVAFSEVLLEVCRWTGFADAFAHLSEGQARANDLHVSICAALLAEACNISLAEVANPGIAALSPNRLSWVSQNYVRAETSAIAAQARLVDSRPPSKTPGLRHTRRPHEADAEAGATLTVKRFGAPAGVRS